MIPKLFQQFIYWPVYLLLKSLFRYRIEGRENLKGLENKPVIFASNHATFMDPQICGTAMPRNSFIPKSFFPVRFVTAKEYANWLKNPAYFPFSLIVAAYVRLNGAIPVARGLKNIEQNLAEAVKILKSGGKVWIYPEGKQTMDGNLQPGKKGTAYLHQITGAVIVPVGISGNFKMFYPLELLKFIFGFKKLTARIGKPIYSFGGVSPEENTKKIMSAIAELIKEN